MKCVDCSAPFLYVNSFCLAARLAIHNNALLVSRSRQFSALSRSHQRHTVSHTKKAVVQHHNNNTLSPQSALRGRSHTGLRDGVAPLAHIDVPIDVRAAVAASSAAALP